MLTGVNIPPTWLLEAASVLNCRTGTIPFSYLGMPIGGDGRIPFIFWWSPGSPEVCPVLSSDLLSFLFQGTYRYNFL